MHGPGWFRCPRRLAIAACVSLSLGACAAPAPPPDSMPAAPAVVPEAVAEDATSPTTAQAATPASLRGLRDASFGQSGSTTFWRKAGEHRFKAIALGKGGEVYVVGHAPFERGTDMAVVRFDATGKLDLTFGKLGAARVGPPQAFGESIALDAEGRAVVAGYAYGKGGANFVVSRLTSRGSVDSSFGKNGIVMHDAGPDDRAQAVHVRDDGTLLISGYHGSDTNQVLCLTADGTPCPGFGTAGLGLVRPVSGKRAYATRSALHGSGGIVLGGYLPSTDRMFVSRLDARGQPDVRFGSVGTTVLDVPVGSAWALSVDRDDRVLIAGHAPSGPAVIARLSADGHIDESFGRNGIAVPEGARDQLFALLSLPSGNILGAGFRGMGDAAQPLFVLLSADGIEERAPWIDDAAPRPSMIFGAALDARGRVLVAGDSPGDRWSAWVGRYN